MEEMNGRYDEDVSGEEGELKDLSANGQMRLRLYGGANRSSIDNEEASDVPFREHILQLLVQYSKMVVLGICWLCSIYFLMMYEESFASAHMITVPTGNGSQFVIKDKLWGKNLALRLFGPFQRKAFRFENRLQTMRNTDEFLNVVLQEVGKDHLKNISSVWRILLNKWDRTNSTISNEKVLEGLNLDFNKYTYQYHFSTNINESLSLNLLLSSCDASRLLGIVLSSILLLIVYAYIAFDLVHRTLAGIICCSLGIGILAVLQLRPTLTQIFKWIHIDTLLLFFGMSIIMAVLAETGFQDYLAAKGYQLANGHIWPMLNVMLITSFLLSSCCNTVTVILFMAPIMLRLCEVMTLNCTPVLICLVIASNIGSLLTPTASVCNMHIAFHDDLPDGPIAYGDYVIHMLPVTILTVIQSYIHVRLLYINSDKMRYTSAEAERLRHMINLWRRAATIVGDVTLDERYYHEAVNTRVRRLSKRLRRLGKMPAPAANYNVTMEQLLPLFKIKNKLHLIYCLIALALFLFISTLTIFVDNIHLSLGWIALVMALLILSLINVEDMEKIMARIDWGTMLFMISLFIIMQVLIELGLLEALGESVEDFLGSLSEQYVLTVAILTIMWLSAFLTNFIDNVPVADMMMHMIVTLSQDMGDYMPLMPLVWSLALGCSLGANGALTGSICSITCAGVANSHGYPFTFMDYMKTGFFIMIGNLIIATLYLLLVHVGFGWK